MVVRVVSDPRGNPMLPNLAPKIYAFFYRGKPFRVQHGKGALTFHVYLWAVFKKHHEQISGTS